MATAARPPRPTPPKPVDPRGIPALAFLCDSIHVRWVAWNYQWVEGKADKPGKWTKVPKQITGKNAKNNDPATWSTFELAWREVHRGRFDGIGLMLLGLPGTLLVAIDLDRVRDPEAGTLVPWAQELVDACKSYCEVTPSAEGVRVLGTVDGTAKLHRRKDPHPSGVGAFELYVNCERFITISGQAINGFNRLAAIARPFSGLEDLLSQRGETKPGSEQQQQKQQQQQTNSATPIDLTTLPLLIVELITKGTIDGKIPTKRGPAFMRLVKFLHGKGYGYGDVLATLRTNPGGVHGKYGNRLEAELRRVWDKLRPPPGAAPDPDTQPEILLLGGKRHLAADAGLAALHAAGAPFYRRDRALVQIHRVTAKASDGTLVRVPAVAPLTTAMLGRALGQVAIWQKVKADSGEIIRIDPPKEVVEQIAGMVNEWPFPPFYGVIGTPTMRPDGSLLVTEGYDLATGFVLFAPPPMPVVPEQPTKRDALDALATLNALLVDFPFANEPSRSVALSMLMTPVLRAALPPAVPAHLITAPEAGTGKSYLQDIAAAIALGDRCPVMSISDSAEETEKRLIGAALAQFPIIALDNVSVLLMGDFLCQATERPVLQIRPLGTSNLARIANTFTTFANGNNLTVAADFVRRTLQCALDAEMENPELREFATDPVEIVLADRGTYIAAVLTIARAYVVAGRPGKLPRRTSYGGWSDIVRSALVWLNWPDPVDSLVRVRAADPVRGARAAVFGAWIDERTPGAGYQTGELITNAEQFIGLDRVRPALFGALFAVAAPRSGHRQIDPLRLAHWLRRNDGTVALGHRLTVDRSDAHRPYWKVVPL